MEKTGPGIVISCLGLGLASGILLNTVWYNYIHAEERVRLAKLQDDFEQLNKINNKISHENTAYKLAQYQFNSELAEKRREIEKLTSQIASEKRAYAVETATNKARSTKISAQEVENKIKSINETQIWDDILSISQMHVGQQRGIFNFLVKISVEEPDDYSISDKIFGNNRCKLIIETASGSKAQEIMQVGKSYRITIGGLKFFVKLSKKEDAMCTFLYNAVPK